MYVCVFMSYRPETNARVLRAVTSRVNRTRLGRSDVPRKSKPNEEAFAREAGDIILRASGHCSGRESQAGAMNPKVMALRKGGIRYDSGTDLVRKTMSASASDSGLAQIVQVRVVP